VKHQQYDTRLKAHFGPVQIMSANAALVANQDLYLRGVTWLGWKSIEDSPVLAAPQREGPPAGLVEALVGLGYKTREAKRLASAVEGGTIEEGIRRICAKELV